MKKFSLLLPAFFFIAVSAAYSQSLGDLADKEKNRREAIKEDVKTIVIDRQIPDQQPETAAPSPGAEKPGTESKEDVANPSAAAKPDPDEPVDFEGRPESFWRNAMVEARQKVKSLEDESKVLALKMAALQTKFYNIDDGFARETVQRDIQKTTYEQDMNKANLEKAQKELQDLEKEARKSGALPGWLR